MPVVGAGAERSGSYPGVHANGRRRCLLRGGRRTAGWAVRCSGGDPGWFSGAGTAAPDSDWDFAVYYRGAGFDPASLRSLGWPGEIFPIDNTAPPTSRPGRPTVMNSRRPSVRAQALGSGHPAGSLRFLVDLSTSAVRNHPGEPDRCVRSLLRGRLQASPCSEGWPLPAFRL